jgi:Ca-activated chloride channel family protein
MIVLLRPACRLAAVLAAATFVGPGGGLVPPARAQFASGVSVVEVYATVTDERGEPITGLTADDFTVREEGQSQTIGAFVAGEFPLAVAVGVDHSFSMTPPRLERARAGARAFVAALRPDDRVMVVGIGSQVEVLAPLSDDRSAAIAALERLEPWGTTPLYDATIEAIDAVQDARGRRALVLLSDGADRYSEASAADLVQHARRRDVLVYPIALGQRRPPVFAELAGVTGGRSSHVTDGDRLEAVLQGIARELRFQYLLGYSPGREPDAEPRWRSIEVSVSGRPGVQVRARDGYFSR